MSTYTKNCDGFEGASFSLAGPDERWNALSGVVSTTGGPQRPASPGTSPVPTHSRTARTGARIPGNPAFLRAGAGAGARRP
jgi:hypothetical protein